MDQYGENVAMPSALVEEYGRPTLQPGQFDWTNKEVAQWKVNPSVAGGESAAFQDQRGPCEPYARGQPPGWSEVEGGEEAARGDLEAVQPPDTLVVRAGQKLVVRWPPAGRAGGYVRLALATRRVRGQGDETNWREDFDPHVIDTTCYGGGSGPADVLNLTNR